MTRQSLSTNSRRRPLLHTSTNHPFLRIETEGRSQLTNGSSRICHIWVTKLMYLREKHINNEWEGTVIAFPPWKAETVREWQRLHRLALDEDTRPVFLKYLLAVAMVSPLCAEYTLVFTSLDYQGVYWNCANAFYPLLTKPLCMGTPISSTPHRLFSTMRHS